MSELALAFAGLRALTDCGTIMAYGLEPSHLKAAVAAGWATRGVTWEGQRRWRHVYKLKIERSRAANMLAGTSAARAAA